MLENYLDLDASSEIASLWITSYIYILLKSEFFESNLFRIEVASEDINSVCGSCEESKLHVGIIRKRAENKIANIVMSSCKVIMSASGVLYIVLIATLGRGCNGAGKSKKREIFRGLDTFLIRNHLSSCSVIPRLCSVTAQGKIFVMSFCSIITL